MAEWDLAAGGVSTLPRAIVITPVFDVAELVAELDRTLLNSTMTGLIEAELRNYATVESEAGVYLLYDFLDQGTKPHWIGSEDELLANPNKNFGPVWGPIWHPGTRPYDITARSGAFLNGFMQELIDTEGDAAFGDEEFIPWRSIRQVLLKGLKATQEFAESITPDSWAAVRNSYALYVNGRRYQD